MSEPTYRKKLIEVALPLAEINAAAAKEKSIRHGHPSTLHLWWARRPLAACRAVLFASLVDDPSSDPEYANKSEAEQDERRKALHQIIKDLVPWENANNPEILARARTEILRCTNGNPPPVLDPFCGGGSIPLEAQRLGLEAHASDLNPVAVLITKALIEIPPRFANQKPANPERHRLDKLWPGATGLAADVRYYGAWMRSEAEKRIGHLYPKANLPKELGGGEATVIAWLWARTVTCPNPACGAEMPLVRSFELSTKKGKETWVDPVVEPGTKKVRFEVRQGKGAAEGTVNRSGARCCVCGSAVPFTYIRAAGRAGNLGQQLMAIVAEGPRSRSYLTPTADHAAIANQIEVTWKPDGEISHWPGRTNVVEYGMTKFADLFTPRQLVALTTFSDLIGEARERVLADARDAGLPDGERLSDNGNGAAAYADAIATYLAFAVDKLADLANSLVRWEPVAQCPRQLFARQAIPMLWDYAEGNPLGESSGSFEVLFEGIFRSLMSALMQTNAVHVGTATQKDASLALASEGKNAIIATDPPYYDNIGYADLSDFFFVWLRRSLRTVHPDLFRTLLVPKSEELIASPYRFDGDRVKAERFFEEGLSRAFRQMRSAHDSRYPLTLFYAFKQREGGEGVEADTSKGSNGYASTGWETMLEGLIGSGLALTGTWPMRTEMGSRMVGQGTNALASSIVLACRPRPENAATATRREFISALRNELDRELTVLLETNIAPVDLAQATIGPGLAIYTRYSQVLEADGQPMRVRAALALINDVLVEVLDSQSQRLDSDTRFCIDWYKQYQYREGPFGEAETLAKAKAVSVDGLARAGVLAARGGRVRLFRREELPSDWDPSEDERMPTWECLQQLIARLEEMGVQGAGALLAKIGAEKGEQSKQLATHLYEICDRKRWTDDARSYNEMVREYPNIQQIIAEDAARYDNYVREYPNIQEEAQKYKIEQGRLL